MLATKIPSASRLPPSIIEAARVAGDLHPAPINTSWIIDGNPQASGRTLFESSDQLVSTFVWECSAGQFHWHYSCDETILILEGSVVLESDGLQPTRYGVGDVILFRKGAHARWHVESRVKKLAVLQNVVFPRLFVSVFPVLRMLKCKFISVKRLLQGCMSSARTSNPFRARRA